MGSQFISKITSSERMLEKKQMKHSIINYLKNKDVYVRLNTNRMHCKNISSMHHSPKKENECVEKLTSRSVKSNFILKSSSVPSVGRSKRHAIFLRNTHRRTI